jgi:hypothetical protein
MNSCLIVQGPTFCDNVLNIKKYWNGIPIIFSTWKDCNKDCYSVDDIVIYNEYPTNNGVKNLNLQKVSSLTGILKAKELGYKRVIKWRQDFYPSDYKKLIKLFKEDCINFYAYMMHEHGYITDYFMEGEIDDMINLFNITDINVPYPEFAFTKRLFEIDLDKKSNFICKDLNKENDIFWKSKNIWLSEQNKSNIFNNFIIS